MKTGHCSNKIVAKPDKLSSSFSGLDVYEGPVHNVDENEYKDMVRKFSFDK